MIESDVPWFPNRERPPAGTPVIQMSVDPLNVRYPVRGFPVDLPIVGNPVPSLRALEAAMEEEIEEEMEDLAEVAETAGNSSF